MFTGRENILLSGLLMGYSKAEMRAREQSIIEFADIGDFIDAPIKRYSSGMQTRLAFAVATEVDPNILVVDEILAVADASFQQKCFARIDNMSQVTEHCDRAIRLEKDSIIADGEPTDVVRLYGSLTLPEMTAVH